MAIMRVLFTISFMILIVRINSECDNVEPPTNGFTKLITEDGNNTKIRIECTPGYVLQVDSHPHSIPYIEIDCIDKEQKLQTVTCEPLECPALENIKNAKKFSNQVKLNSVIEFKCEPGFIGMSFDGRRVGSFFKICLPDGTWLDTFKVNECIKIECEIPKAPPDVTLTPVKPKYSYGETLTISCRNGFWFRGLTQNLSSICNGDTTWSLSSIPQCTPLQTSDHPDPGLESENATSSSVTAESLIHQSDMKVTSSGPATFPYKNTAKSEIETFSTGLSTNMNSQTASELGPESTDSSRLYKSEGISSKVDSTTPETKSSNTAETSESPLRSNLHLLTLLKTKESMAGKKSPSTKLETTSLADSKSEHRLFTDFSNQSETLGSDQTKTFYNDSLPYKAVTMTNGAITYPSIHEQVSSDTDGPSVSSVTINDNIYHVGSAASPNSGDVFDSPMDNIHESTPNKIDTTASGTVHQNISDSKFSDQTFDNDQFSASTVIYSAEPREFESTTIPKKEPRNDQFSASNTYMQNGNEAITDGTFKADDAVVSDSQLLKPVIPSIQTTTSQSLDSVGIGSPQTSSQQAENYITTTVTEYGETDNNSELNNTQPTETTGAYQSHSVVTHDPSQGTINTALAGVSRARSAYEVTSHGAGVSVAISGSDFPLEKPNTKAITQSTAKDSSIEPTRSSVSSLITNSSGHGDYTESSPQKEISQTSFAILQEARKVGQTVHQMAPHHITESIIPKITGQSQGHTGMTYSSDFYITRKSYTSLTGLATKRTPYTSGSIFAKAETNNNTKLISSNTFGNNPTLTKTSLQEFSTKMSEASTTDDIETQHEVSTNSKDQNKKAWDDRTKIMLSSIAQPLTDVGETNNDFYNTMYDKNKVTLTSIRDLTTSLWERLTSYSHSDMVRTNTVPNNGQAVQELPFSKDNMKVNPSESKSEAQSPAETALNSKGDSLSEDTTVRAGKVKVIEPDSKIPDETGDEIKKRKNIIKPMIIVDILAIVSCFVIVLLIYIIRRIRKRRSLRRDVEQQALQLEARSISKAGASPKIFYSCSNIAVPTDKTALKPLQTIGLLKGYRAPLPSIAEGKVLKGTKACTGTGGSSYDFLKTKGNSNKEETEDVNITGTIVSPFLDRDLDVDTQVEVKNQSKNQVSLANTLHYENEVGEEREVKNLRQFKRPIWREVHSNKVGPAPGQDHTKQVYFDKRRSDNFKATAGHKEFLNTVWKSRPREQE